MTALDLARMQFGITTIFHFFFVPVSIGLAFYVAVCQTRHYRTGKAIWARQVNFFGKLFLISFAVGVVTGIIQEFQFGMNWSDYSRFVGDIFGAPLAMEGLAAFFLESTFIGLWIFGKGRLSPRVHLVTIWLVSIGSALSAWFIIAANSWMQNPVGYKPGKTPELTDIGAVLFSSTTLWAFSHVLSAALITGALVALAVCAWQLRNGGDGAQFGSGLRLSLTLLCVGLVAAFFFGDALMRDLVTRQPMKVAAAEALFETEGPAALSLFATGDFSANPGKTNREIKIPHLLSLLATLSWDGTVQGVNNVNAQYRKEFGPGEYAPVVAVIYWSFRVMVYTYGALVMFALIGLWLWRKAEARHVTALAQAGHLGGRDSLPDQHRRLGDDRDGAPALDRAGPAQDRGRGQPAGDQRPGRAVPGRLPGPLQPARGASPCVSSCGKRSTSSPPTTTTKRRATEDERELSLAY